MIDLSEWKFVTKDVMRSKTVGDWDTQAKEIVAWSGLDPLTRNEVWTHELVEAVICDQLGITDKVLLGYDHAHDLAREVSDAIVSAAGENPTEHEQQIVKYESEVDYYGRR